MARRYAQPDQDGYPVLITVSEDGGTNANSRWPRRNAFLLPPGDCPRAYAVRCIETLFDAGQIVFSADWGWGTPDGTLVLT